MEKVKLIAHRGLYNGPDKVKENNPQQILDSINLGFDAEIDLHIIDKKFYLGHDEPQYLIDESFLRNSAFWIHAKNLEALYWLSTTDLKYFWHQNDDRVVTSNGYIWTYPEKELTDRSIRLMPEWNDPEFKTIKEHRCFAICSDYVFLIREILSPSTKV